jgi:phosphatidylserine decarboxylase
MKTEAILFYNRYTEEVEEEKIYGDQWLRWTYETAPGRLLLNLLIKRPVLSHFYGWRMDRPTSRKRIAPFIEKFGVNTSEFAGKPEEYATFNDFFYRHLKPEARPIAEGENVACFPADGRHLAYQDLAKVPGFIAKGQRFDLRRFLDDEMLAERYRDGAMLVSRLCPVDYHRFHFPCAGIPGETRLVNGWLYSVNPIALRRNAGYLVENKRAFCEIETEKFGKVLFAEIGATFVGGMAYTYAPGMPMGKGSERGYFRFGGSCTILLFEKNRIRFDNDLVENTGKYLETYARMGDQLGIAMES